MSIPFEHIERVTVSESDVKGLLKGDLKLKGFRPALKLDWANFVEHVVLDKREGFVRRVLFTPDDSTAFKAPSMRRWHGSGKGTTPARGKRGAGRRKLDLAGPAATGA